MKKKSRFDLMEEGLARARAAIQEATRARNYSSYKDESFVPRGDVYINPYAFHQLRFFALFLLYNIVSYSCFETNNIITGTEEDLTQIFR